MRKSTLMLCLALSGASVSPVVADVGGWVPVVTLGLGYALGRATAPTYVIPPGGRMGGTIVRERTIVECPRAGTIYQRETGMCNYPEPAKIATASPDPKTPGTPCRDNKTGRVSKWVEIDGKKWC